MTKMEVVLDDAYPNVAFVKWPNGYAEIHGSRVGREERARLFAASEELMEALQNLLDMDIAYRRGPRVEDAVEVARAAIAKATGGFTP